MKVIGIYQNYNNNDNTPCSLNTFLMADSSLAKSGKPWFLPDFAEGFEYHAHLVFRIGRLGKNIAKRFAYRYVDAVTVGATVTAINAPDNNIAHAFDGAAMIGDFIPVEEINNLESIIGEISTEGCESVKYSANEMACKIDELIEYLSQYFTLKIGDIIYAGYGDSPKKLGIGQTISGTLNGKDVLNIKIK